LYAVKCELWYCSRPSDSVKSDWLLMKIRGPMKAVQLVRNVRITTVISGPRESGITTLRSTVQLPAPSSRAASIRDLGRDRKNCRSRKIASAEEK
jgi:hypothetical protein